MKLPCKGPEAEHALCVERTVMAGWARVDELGDSGKRGEDREE